jgi:signal transduction histidine kinase
LKPGPESESAPQGGIAHSLGAELRAHLRDLSQKIGLAIGEDAGGLLLLQTSLIEHYFKLQAAERNLSGRAQSLRRGEAASAVRQIERERQRLGRELHTGIGQLLAAIRLQCEVINAQLPHPPEAVTHALERIAALAADALEQVRALSRRLHPPEWQRLSLEEALRQLWDLSGVPQAFEAAITLRPLPREPEMEIKVLFYRTTQEALSNLTRHSKATRVSLILEPRDSMAVLTIEDNGVGFDVARYLAQPPSLGSGIGLRSVREQAAALGGEMTIESGPGRTKLVITAPFVPVES